MRNHAAEVPTLWHLAVLRPCWVSLAQGCSPSAGHLSPVRQQWWQHSSGTLPDPLLQNQAKTAKYFVLSALGLVSSC